ncbi:MAG: hypothetical protein KJ046_07790 [Anaerolineae bacterium]|nr:hypothetical protein [Anaerolineae bacterium]RIK18667.1 MAG: hypothetical protein DCC51_10110 [Anaerolineae bacterium]
MSDMVFGAIGLIIFLAVIFIAGYFLYMFKNARFKNAWGPLVSLVDGKVVDDGGGGATSWLVGSYKGWKVQASMTPGRNMYSQNDSSGPKYNYFEIALADVPGKHDWSVIYDRKILGVGQTGWRVKSEDPAMEESLTAADISSLIIPFGEPANHFTFPPLEYNRRERLLRFQYDNGGQWVPTAQSMIAQLEMLIRAAEINKRVNPA